MSWGHLPISGISQLLPTQCWPNFKVRFLEPSLTASEYQVDICRGNICPGDICPYEEYLSFYWPNVDQTLKVKMPTVMVIFVHSTFVLVTFGQFRNISILTKTIFDLLFLEPDHFSWNCCTQNLLDSTFFWTKIFFGLKFFGVHNLDGVALLTSLPDTTCLFLLILKPIYNDLPRI